MPRLSTAVRLAAIAFCLGNVQVSRAADDRFTTDVFTGGVGGYHTYRIPSLLVPPGGALLAFCEGRKTGPPDHGDTDPPLRRGDAGGAPRGPTPLVYEEGGTRPVTIGNPCPVVDT